MRTQFILFQLSACETASNDEKEIFHTTLYWFYEDSTKNFCGSSLLQNRKTGIGKLVWICGEAK